MREMLVDKSIACKIMIYPKYMIVNKTMDDIIYNYNRNYFVKSKTNDFMFGEHEVEKMSFKVKRF